MSELAETIHETIHESGEHGHKGNPFHSLIGILVAMTATCMAIISIKGHNVVQTMNQTQSNINNQWAYYQAKSTKQNLAEATLELLKAQREINPSTGSALDSKIQSYQGKVERYEKEKSEIKLEAETLQKKHHEFHAQHEKFNIAEGAFSLSLALLALAALTQRRWLLAVGCALALVGVGLGVWGWMGWGIHHGA